VGRVGHSACILRPPHPVGLGNLPDPRVRVGRANPIGLKPDPTITLIIQRLFKKMQIQKKFTLNVDAKTKQTKL